MKRYRPTTKSRRQMTTISFRKHITSQDPHKALVSGGKRMVGRNHAGRITVRHKGGGHKRLFRDVDFKLEKINIPAKVVSVEYDPNRSGFISLANYADGEKRYMLTPEDVKVGATLIASESAAFESGNRMPLRRIPTGTFVYNIEIHPRGGAKLVRSAGSFAQVLGHADGYTQIKMPSTEVRKINENSWATIGRVSNPEHNLVVIGKAGRSRWMGIRPTVRGTAMNPVDHPHGGGEGRQGRGTRRAKMFSGKPTGKGQKTRRAKKYSNVFIVERRKVGKKK
ncbi:MAG TPA: 50S ribosomal protein L2 [Candidatus Paceibacterota bacterium]